TFDWLTDFVAGFQRIPRIALKLLHAERELLVGFVDPEDDGFHFVALFVLLGWVVEFLRPSQIRNVNETVDTHADVDEYAEVRNRFDFRFFDHRADWEFDLELVPRI